MKSSSNKTKGDNSKRKKGRVVILVCDMLSGPVLHFYQVSSKYFNRLFKLQSGQEVSANADADARGGGDGGHNLSNIGPEASEEKSCEILKQMYGAYTNA